MEVLPCSAFISLINDTHSFGNIIWINKFKYYYRMIIPNFKNKTYQLHTVYPVLKQTSPLEFIMKI